MRILFDPLRILQEVLNESEGVQNATNGKLHTEEVEKVTSKNTTNGNFREHEIEQVSDYATNEQERAKERQGSRSDLSDDTDDEPVGNVSHKSEDKERARDKAAEKINADVSGLLVVG